MSNVSDSISWGNPLTVDGVVLNIEYSNFSSISILDEKDFLIENKKSELGEKVLGLSIDKTFDENGQVKFRIVVLDEDDNIIEEYSIVLNKAVTKSR